MSSLTATISENVYFPSNFKKTGRHWRNEFNQKGSNSAYLEEDGYHDEDFNFKKNEWESPQGKMEISKIGSSDLQSSSKINYSKTSFFNSQNLKGNGDTLREDWNTTPHSAIKLQCLGEEPHRNWVEETKDNIEFGQNLEKGVVWWFKKYKTI